MAWIKRNLYFVITVAVGLGVAGFCGYLLYSAWSQNEALSGKYSSDKSNLDSLQQKVPYPNPENIQAAEADAERVRAFLAEFGKPFASFPQPPQLDDRHFKEYLQKSVLQFGAEATNAGVGLPPGYAFSFSQQMNVLNYSSDSIAPWMQELAEIRAILHILYNAKINYLQQIQRPIVSGEEPQGDDYLAIGTVTNLVTSAVVTPYKVNFRGFSAEIANVLAGIAASSNCFIVKTIYVSPSKEPLPQLADLQPAAPAPVMQYRPQPDMSYNNPAINNPFIPGGGASRFGRRPMGPQPPVYQQPVYQTPAPTAPVGPLTILTETPLFVTLYIDVVKLKVADAPRAPVAPGRPGKKDGALMDFLKKHYEKIVLCVVLLGLAGAVLWMESAVAKKTEELPPIVIGPPPKTAPPTPLDLSVYQQALADITNPPPLVLSGEHNLFNPVTWKRKQNGYLIKIVKTGPDALMVTNIVPLYTIISFEYPSPGSPVYVMSAETNVDLRKPNPRKHTEHARKDEKVKSGLYLVRGIKGAEDNPSEVNLEITQTGETNVWVSTNTPYKRADSYLADLKYDPDPTLSLVKKRVNDEFKLDNEPYKIVEITNDAVRVQDRRTTKVTEIKWTPSHNGD